MMSLSLLVLFTLLGTVSGVSAGIGSNTSQELWDQLKSAAEKRDVGEVIAALQKGVDVDAKGYYEKETALMVAAKEGHADVVCQSLSYGADANAQDKDGRTALLHASIWTRGTDRAQDENKVALVRALLDAGANVNDSSSSGNTLLMSASYGRAPIAVVQFLLSHGADVHAKTKTGLTALMKASSHMNSDGVVLDRVCDCVTLLLQAGADDLAADERGWTALTHASDTYMIADGILKYRLKVEKTDKERSFYRQQHKNQTSVIRQVRKILFTKLVQRIYG